MGAPSDDEAAAAIAAVEALIGELSVSPAASEPPPDAWRSAALLEGVSRTVEPDLLEPWIKT